MRYAVAVLLALAVMSSVLSAAAASAASVLGWLALAVFFAVAQGWPRPLFIAVHYLLCVAAYALCFWAYFSWVRQPLSPFVAMVVAMLTAFVIEIIVFRFLYTGSLWFLNFVDWIVPVFLIASTIYAVGALLAR